LEEHQFFSDLEEKWRKVKRKASKEWTKMTVEIDSLKERNRAWFGRINELDKLTTIATVEATLWTHGEP
jgi:hypothetical protein